ncbi:MAG: tetratricopeptide repeat protein [Planctomycetota bacterium]
MQTPSTPLSRRTAILAVLAVAVLVYLNTLGHELVYDDKVIVQTPGMHDPWKLAALFGSDFYGGTHAHVDLYRPLTAFSFALNWWANGVFGAAGESPFLFHLTNVLLHAAASALVFVFAERLALSRWAALAAALLFAVHPLHTEPVANVYARSELLAAAFGLAFLCLARGGRPVLGALCLFVAVSSKESAVVFLPVALLLDAWMPAGGPRLRGMTLVLGALALGAWATLRAAALAGHDHAHDEEVPFVENPLVALDAGGRIASALKVQLAYLRLLVLPTTLSSDYSFDQVAVAQSFADPHVLGLIAIAVVGIAAAFLTRRTRPVIGFCVLAYAITWAATANVLFPIGTIQGERLAYAPSILACVLGAVLLDMLRERAGTNVFLAATGVLVVLGSVRTIVRNPTWKDEPTLFREQTISAPRSAKAHVNLGMLLSKEKDHAGALAAFERAAEIYPGHAQAQFRLGNELYFLGTDLARAEAAYRKAIEADPKFIDPRINRCYVLLRLGRVDAARAAIEETRRLAPRHRAFADLDAQLRAAQQKPAPSGG